MGKISNFINDPVIKALHKNIDYGKIASFLVTTYSWNKILSSYQFFMVIVYHKNYQRVFLQPWKSYWWLVESHLSGYFCLFAPKFWEGDGDLNAVNAVGVVSTLIGCGDTWTLTAIIEFIWTFYTQRLWDAESLLLCSSHLVKLLLPNIWYYCLVTNT